MNIDQIDPKGLTQVKPHVYAELEAINITPWYGGRHEPDTVVCLNEKCREIYISLPTAKSIKGLLRWLMRIAIASYIPDDLLNSYGYRVTDCYPKCNSEEPGIIEALFGAIEQPRETMPRPGKIVKVVSRAGALDITVNIEYDQDNLLYVKDYNTLRSFIENLIKHYYRELKNKPHRLLALLEELGYDLLRGSTHFKTEIRISSDLQKYINALKDYITLFTIPRVYLNAQRIGNIPTRNKGLLEVVDLIAKELFEIQPLRSKTLKLKISIGLREDLLPPYLRKREIIPSIKCVIIKLLVFGLTVIGLGKASTRGFGKFKVQRYEIYDEAVKKNIVPLINNLLDPENLKENYTNFIQHVIKDVGELLKEITSAETIKLYDSVVKIPRLSNVLIDIIEDPKHPCMISSREYTQEKKVANYCGPEYKKKSVNVARINSDIKALSAIGKATLKSTWKMYWYSIRTKKVSSSHVREPGFMFHTWSLGLPRQVNLTGYHVISINDIISYRSTNVDYCVPSGDLGHIISRKTGLKRWKSPIIFTPIVLPSSHVKIIIILFKYNDLRDFFVGDEKLVHIGRHRRSPLYHVIDIASGISFQHSTLTSECGNEYVQKAEPNGKTVRVSLTTIVEDTVKNSLKWVKFLLS